MRSISIGILALTALAFAGEAAAQSRGNSGGYGSQPQGTGSNPRSNSVDGYTNKNGNYVQPYQRTNPDNSRGNNYNAPGNYNPNPPRR